MRTAFSPEQLAHPPTAASEREIRRCVHCGFCTATCPTYVLLGDELDSPRGRIYLIKEMLEADRAPSAEVVKHIDRCLSCLACETTCPSGVSYRRLVDQARAYIEDRYQRPWPDRLYRGLLARVLPYPNRMRAALALAPLGRPLAPLLARTPALRPLAAMLDLATPARRAAVATPAAVVAAPKGRVALLRGCVEPVLRPQIQAAAERLLALAGWEVVRVAGEGCCGALPHHMGREAEALAFARRNVDAWTAEIVGAGLDAIVVTASGCGSVLKDYAVLLRDDPAYAAKAARIAALARDVCELLGDLPAPAAPTGLTVAYHPPCSLQHGQRLKDLPRRLLETAGFKVVEPAEAHLCCGSAGVYNILQPELAGQLRARKVEHLQALKPDVIATGNVGCLAQIAAGSALPVVGVVELLDWAAGGSRPTALDKPGPGQAPPGGRSPFPAHPLKVSAP